MNEEVHFFIKIFPFQISAMNCNYSLLLIYLIYFANKIKELIKCKHMDSKNLFDTSENTPPNSYEVEFYQKFFVPLILSYM